MKTTIAIALTGLALLAGCGSDDESTEPTTTTVPALTDSDVEGYFADKRSDKAFRLSDVQSTVTVDKVDCTIEDAEAGEARCFERVTVEDNLGYAPPMTQNLAWSVTYDTETGEILSYTK